MSTTSGRGWARKWRNFVGIGGQENCARKCLIHHCLRREKAPENWFKSDYGLSNAYEFMTEGSAIWKQYKTRVNPVLTDRVIRNVCATARDSIGQSNRVLGRRYKISKNTALKALTIGGMKNYRRVTVPLATKKQSETRQRESANPKFQIIMDDESYFSLYNDNYNTNDRFWTDNVSNTPDRIRYMPKWSG